MSPAVASMSQQSAQVEDTALPPAVASTSQQSAPDEDTASDSLMCNLDSSTVSTQQKQGISGRRNLHGLKVPADLNVEIQDGPTQPKLGKFPPTKFGSQNRAFSASYYTTFDFLEYSVQRDAVFCFCCRMFPNASGERVFTESGFNNWKDIGECLKHHAKSICHAEAVARWQGARSVDHGKVDAISLQVNKQAKDVVTKNRAAVGSLARIAITCARQDIALRGHHEHTDLADNRGNFLEILELIKLESTHTKSNLDRLPKNANYTSKDAQNDLLKAAAAVVTSKIVAEVKSAGMFTVIADEARDISISEQMSICLRYVVGHTVNEHFLTFVTLHDDLSAGTLAKEIAESLTAQGIDLKSCVAQCYDGASVMSGEFNGVQQQFRVLCGSPCVYVHCYAHRVNLVLVDACTAVRPVGDLFGLLEAVYNYITSSSIRHDKFVSVQEGRGERVMALPLQSDTQWVCKLKAVTTFKKRFVAVVSTLEFFCESKNHGNELRLRVC